MENFAYSLTDYSFLALSIGERLLFLSMAGWFLLWMVARCFHRNDNENNKGRQVAMAPLWMVYLLWLVPAASPFFPAMPQVWLENSSFFSGLLSNAMLENPCAISPVERLGTSLLPSSMLITDSNLLLLLWCAISLLLLLRVCTKRASFRYCIRRAAVINDPTLLAMLAQLRTNFAITRSVYLCTSDDYSSPFTMGVLRPVIFIPQTLLKQLTNAEIKAVLAHECAHIARRDDVAVCWQQLVSVVFFFNPLLGYANRQLAQMREICCDHLAIRRCGFEPRVYARALLRVVEQLGGGVPEQRGIPVPALLGQDVQLRLQALVNPHNNTYRWWPALTLLCGLLCVSFFLGGTGKQVAPVVQGDAVKARVSIPYAMPIENGRITSGVHFHQPLGCYLPSREDFHAGIDFAPAENLSALAASAATTRATSVRAFADGVIESINKPPHDIGFMVHISHAQGLQSTYVRLDQVNLPVGSHVSVGQVFATTGASPQTNHVHFELTQRGQILDPAILFRE